MSTTSDAVRAFAAWLAREYPEIQREHMADAADAYLGSVAEATNGADLIAAEIDRLQREKERGHV